MDVQARDTHATFGVTGFAVTAAIWRLHEDERGIPEGCESIRLALSPGEAREMAAALNEAARQAEGKILGQMALFEEMEG